MSHASTGLAQVMPSRQRILSLKRPFTTDNRLASCKIALNGSSAASCLPARLIYQAFTS